MKKFYLICMTLFMAVIMAGCNNSFIEVPTLSYDNRNGISQTEEVTKVSEGVEKPKNDNTQAKASENITIGIIQSQSDDNSTDMYTGFINALAENGYSEGDNIKIDYIVADTEMECMQAADRFVNEECSYIYAIGDAAVHAAKNRTQDIVIIAAGVEDMRLAGYVNSDEVPGTNISGVSSLVKEEVQAELIRKISPDAKNILVLYSSDVKSRIKAQEFEEACKKLGMSVKYARVLTGQEIRTVLTDTIKDVDIVYSPSDSVVYSNMADAAGICNDNKIPFIANGSDMVTYGSLAACVPDYKNIGRRCADMLVRVINEEKLIVNMPVEYLIADECSVVVNQTTKDILGITIPEAATE